MCPDDLLGTPTCNCLFVQPDSWMYTGQDITSERKDTSAFACSARSQRHQRQRLLTYVCTCETAAQAQTLGLWGWAGQLSSDTSQWTTTLLFGWCSRIPALRTARFAMSRIHEVIDCLSALFLKKCYCQFFRYFLWTSKYRIVGKINCISAI